MRIEQIEFTIFDTETSGLYPEAGDRIIEIAGIRFKGKQKIATFNTLVNSHVIIPENIQQIHNISNNMLIDAPSIEKVIPEFLEFIRGSYLCAYNAGFDLAFLKNEIKLLNLDYPEELTFIDILKMVKRLLPGFKSYSLKSVGQNLGVEFGGLHRAMADAQLAYEIFIRLKEKLEEKQIFELEDLIGLFAIDGKVLEDINQKKIILIQEAINGNLKIKIKYLSAKDGVITQRIVLPEEIKYEERNIYIVGHCFLREEERSFRLDGILHIEII